MAASGDPVRATDVTAVSDLTTSRPLVRLVQQTGQNAADNITIAITFGAGSEDIDTHGFHDTAVNTSRVTPTVAGYYECKGSVVFAARTDYRIMDGFFRKNGATIIAAGGRRSENGATTSTYQVAGAIFATVSFNGTTDYIELLGVQTNALAATPLTSVSGAGSSVLEMTYVRGL